MPDRTTELTEIAVEGYTYLYPLVTMELTRRQTTNVAAGTRPGRGPMNQFAHLREFPTADFKVVVRPNFDTLYSSAWLDLRDGPVIVSAPDTGDRYYLLPMLDMWTDVFAVPGTRTSGNRAASWAVVPRGWQDDLPPGVDRIESPTPYVWLIGRTQTNGPADYPAVRTVQDGYGLSRLSTWPEPIVPEPVDVDPTIDMETPPLEQVDALSGEAFFALGADLMSRHRPHPTDWSTLARLQRLGVVPGRFVAGELSAEARAAVDQAPGAARSALQVQLPRLAKAVNGWQMNTDTIGVYGDFYVKRAIVAMVGLGANPPEDALYPLLIADAGGAPVDGSHDYVLSFEKDGRPPVGAFWSVTIYDHQGFQVANELDRFALGDRDPLRYNADGSLDLYVQRANPGADRVANWLPTPDGPLGITMRLYAPDRSVLNGTWAPPPLRRLG